MVDRGWLEVKIGTNGDQTYAALQSGGKMFFQFGLSANMLTTGIIPFDVDLGSSTQHTYDYTTGKFIAQNEGVYFFHLSFSPYDKNKVNAFIMADGVPKCIALSIEIYNGVSCAAVVHLRKGQVSNIRL